MKLPKFIYNKVKTHSTSLGNNAAFPPEEDYPFDYKLLKKRYIQVVERLKTHPNLKNLSDDELVSRLSSLLSECERREEPIRGNLETLCENIVAKLFSVPVETVDLKCEITHKIQPKNPFRLLPEDSDSRDFDFDSLQEFDDILKVILKKRFINSLVLGASKTLSNISKYESLVSEFDNDICSLYEEIDIINDYLLFAKKEKISDKHPMQGACVEVELGREGEKSKIHAQGLIFPYLLNETLRGFFELFSSHGLPKDNKKAAYIIKQADFLLAEPWDLRFGVPLWELLNDNIDSSKILPYYFMSLCEMKVDDFNDTVREILARTKQGKKIQSDLIAKAKHDFDYDDLSATIQLKNADKSILTDEYMTEDDIDNYIIDEDDSNSPSYQELLINCDYTDIDFTLIPHTVNGVYTSRPMYVVTPIIYDQVTEDDIEIPSELVYLRAEVIWLDDTNRTYQLHITIDESIRQLGIATKLYRAFINIHGSACSLYKNRKENYYKTNNLDDSTNGAISKLWAKLDLYPEINITPLNRNDQEIGVIAIKQ